MRRVGRSHAGEVAAVVEAGRKLWTTKFRNGRTLATCFPNGGRRIAATYPLYDARLKAVVTLEMAINQCPQDAQRAALRRDGPATMGAVWPYVRSLANGQKIAVRCRLPRNRSSTRQAPVCTRMGQRNYACASCHVQGAGQALRGIRFFRRRLRRRRAGRSSATPWRHRAGAHARMPGAHGRRAVRAGSDELNQLEYYVTWLANGKPVKANAWRPK
jgi:sulfur-oxidizing protein SoxA